MWDHGAVLLDFKTVFVAWAYYTLEVKLGLHPTVLQEHANCSMNVQAFATSTAQEMGVLGCHESKQVFSEEVTTKTWPT